MPELTSPEQVAARMDGRSEIKQQGDSLSGRND